MTYKLVRKPAFKVTGKSLLTTQEENQYAGTISAFWMKCNQDGTSEELVRLMRSQQVGDALVGVCYGLQQDGTFEYLVGAEVAAEPQEPGLTTIEIPASEWMIFEAIGPMPAAIQDVWQKIFAEVLPASGYQHAGTPDMEVYYDGDTKASDYRCEVWIPVRMTSNK